MFLFLSRFFKLSVLTGLFLFFVFGQVNPVSAGPNIFGTDDKGGTLVERIAGGAGYDTAVTDLTLAETIGRIIQVVLSVVGTIFFVLVVYAGYIWLMARGDEGEVEKATSIIKMAVIGLVITLSAYTVSFFVVKQVGNAAGGSNKVGGSRVPAGTPGSGSESGADCKDGKKTNFETDTDCGGGYCPKCVDGKKCIGDADCVSGSCVSGTCAKAAETCDDGILNGSEGDTDCGGTCPDRCGSGRKCKISSDCLAGVTCNTGICNGGPTCFDKIQNGNESDTDCGGSDCIKCDVGEMCKSSSDCKSGTCTSGRCK